MKITKGMLSGKWSLGMVLFFLMHSFNLVFADDKKDPVLLRIAGEEIPVSEFLRVYQKNNLKEHPLERAALEEYLELYINFKLKVKEAMDLKMDTVPAFINELSGYRKQLAEPYLTDKVVDDQLVREAYDRMQYDIRASHILVRVAKDAGPSDTLAAFQKIMSIYKRILNGEDFGNVAAEVSEDQSARDREASSSHPFMKGNRGDLGYFTAFDMVYPFENGAYNAAPGKVTLPVRTDYGYHLIMVTNKHKALGKAQVAHIYVKFPADNNAEDSLKAIQKINQAYERLNQGAIFDDVVLEFSDDKGTAKKGGVLSWFGSNRMVPEFIEAVYRINNIGDYSEPFTTNYGWHIIKLIDRKEIGDFESEEPEIRKKLTKDSRASVSRDSFISKVKKQYNFTENRKALQDFYNIVDDSIFFGRWDAGRAKNLNKVMFTIDGKEYNQQAFADYLDQTQRNRTSQDLKTYVNDNYRTFVEKTCIDFKDSRLEIEYPDFGALMKEYHDGILLFELTDKKVWTKAVKDTSGLKDFHEMHRNDYMWGERLDASVFTCSSDKIAAKVRKATEKSLKKGFEPSRILASVNKDTVVNLTIQRDKFSRGDLDLIDGIEWKPGLTQNILKDGKTVFVLVHEVVPPEPKALNEARGLITADYQTYLEKEWIRLLKDKYQVEVFKEAFDSIIK